MGNRTDNQTEVGKHRFEIAGLGKAPFRFIGVSQNRITYPDGSSKAGGTCDYCGNGLEYECIIVSSDGRQSKVGSSCIEKVGGKGLLKAYKNSPEVRAKRRESRARVARENLMSVTIRLKQLMDEKKTIMLNTKHPYGFTDRSTGRPMTFMDWAQWIQENGGIASKCDAIRKIGNL